MDITKLSFAELNVLQDDVAQELKKREKEEVAKAREQIMAIAQNVGIPLNELIGGKAAKVSTGRKVPVRYRHPSDPTLQWTGRGRQPQWIKDWVENGRSMDALDLQQTN